MLPPKAECLRAFVFVAIAAMARKLFNGDIRI